MAAHPCDPAEDQQKQSPLTIKRDDDFKWQVVRDYPHDVKDFHHGNDGPWPQPAPDNPVGQMAVVVHLPEQEKKDWRKYVGNMYMWRALTRWPLGLWYALTHNRYQEYDDARFNEELTEGLYSKFLTPLDKGDLALFSNRLKDSELDIKNHQKYLKADFSCMESVAPHCFTGMYAAPTITLVERDHSEIYGLRHKVVAIYLYEVEEKAGKVNTIRENVFLPQDGDHWELAKYFVLQGAVHRVNLTEHALLHFPFDCINAITKTVLPISHPLFQLLIPHFTLSLGVNKAVLENPGSLINRDKHKFYSPFCAEGEFIRRLLPHGYIGFRRNGEENLKPNGYPPYDIRNHPRIIRSRDKGYLSDYYEFLQAYYDVFAEFVPKVLNAIEDDDRESWEYIGLWADCIEEWMPGFPKREQLIDEDGKPIGRECLNRLVTLIMWDLSLAHATDHIEIWHKRPHGNPFRLRVPPPTRGPVTAGWRGKLVKRRDLLSFWFTELLFYRPNNVTRLDQVHYDFSRLEPRTRQMLEKENKKFLQALRDCERQLHERKVRIPARLDQISASLQY